jgi:hypothetical protein
MTGEKIDEIVIGSPFVSDIITLSDKEKPAD